MSKACNTRPKTKLSLSASSALRQISIELILYLPSLYHSREVQLLISLPSLNVTNNYYYYCHISMQPKIDLPVMVPFPSLPATVSTREPGYHHNRKKQNPTLWGNHCQNKAKGFHKQQQQTSAPIPLPKAHVKRTPSELQFDENKRQAEYDILCMDARIANGRYGHPTLPSPQPYIQKECGQKEASINKKRLRPKRGVSTWELAYVLIDKDLKSNHPMKRGAEDDEDDVFVLDL